MKPNFHGMQFGRLTVLAAAEPDKFGRAYWLCGCECGATKPVAARHLVRGAIKSCGCLSRETVRTRSITHGQSKTPTYRIWADMRNRCENPNNTAHKDYGGRGIKVCERWADFPAFVADMGKRPAGMTIDRVDTNGDYEPSNCRWTTMTEQQRNRRNNHRLRFRGETLTIAEWSERTGIRQATISMRLHRYGWPVERALTVRPARGRA